MIDVASEQLVILTKAPSHIPGRPHLATVYRWFQKGVRGGVKLETALVGGRRFTSVEAIQRFVERLSGGDGAAHGGGNSQPPRTPTQRERASSKASAELAASGW